MIYWLTLHIFTGIGLFKIFTGIGLFKIFNVHLHKAPDEKE